MSDFIIETQIDKLIDLLTKRRKIPLSEAARELNISQSQLEVWVSTLEDSGVVELKYPVLGQPEIVLKGILPENLKIVPEVKKTEEPIRTETPKREEGFFGHFEKKVEPSYESSYTGKIEAEEKEIRGLEEKIGKIETEEKEIKHLEEKIDTLEKKISEFPSKSLEGEDRERKILEGKISTLEKSMQEVAEEIDISKLKEELFEVLIIISSLNDSVKIASYLTFIERLILALKAKKAWDKVDKDLMVSTLRNTSTNWKEEGKLDIAKVFEEMAKKIETI